MGAPHTYEQVESIWWLLATGKQIIEQAHTVNFGARFVCLMERDCRNKCQSIEK